MNTSVYNTTDTALAAFLAISGIKLVKLNTEQKLAVYTFEDHNNLQDLVTQWESELSPFRQFYNTYRSFIRQIKEKNSA